MTWVGEAPGQLLGRAATGWASPPGAHVGRRAPNTWGRAAVASTTMIIHGVIDGMSRRSVTGALMLSESVESAGYVVALEHPGRPSVQRNANVSHVGIRGRGCSVFGHG